MKETLLFEGVTLSYCSFDRAHDHSHTPMEHILEINYCRDGRIGWDLGDGNRIFLGPGDFSVHTMKACADSHISLPENHYEGLSITLDLKQLSEKAPSVFSGCTVDISGLPERWCRNGRAACFSGTPGTDAIFSRFYSEDSISLHRIKALELIALLCLKNSSDYTSPAEYKNEQVELVHSVHDYLLEHIGERATIEEISKRFAVNPTTLKATFKAVYGDSLAAHIKRHRMEEAAHMLLSTAASLNEIASSVGYESQSKFTAAFRDFYNMLPSEYRRKNTKE